MIHLTTKLKPSPNIPNVQYMYIVLYTNTHSMHGCTHIHIMLCSYIYVCVYIRMHVMNVRMYVCVDACMCLIANIIAKIMSINTCYRLCPLFTVLKEISAMKTS